MVLYMDYKYCMTTSCRTCKKRKECEEEDANSKGNKQNINSYKDERHRHQDRPH